MTKEVGGGHSQLQLVRDSRRGMWGLPIRENTSTCNTRWRGGDLKKVGGRQAGKKKKVQRSVPRHWEKRKRKEILPNHIRKTSVLEKMVREGLMSI